MDCKVAALPAMTGKRESVIARKARMGRRGDPVCIAVRDAKVSAGLPHHSMARNDRERGMSGLQGRCASCKDKRRVGVRALGGILAGRRKKNEVLLKYER